MDLSRIMTTISFLFRYDDLSHLDLVSFLIPCFIGLPLLYVASTRSRPIETCTYLCLWIIHVILYLCLCWRSNPVTFARTLSLTTLFVILSCIGILFFGSFLCWILWRGCYKVFPYGKEPPSARQLKEVFGAAWSHCFVHIISHTKVRHLLNNRNIKIHSEKDIGWLLRRSTTKNLAILDETDRFRLLFDRLPKPKLPFQLSLSMNGFRQLPKPSIDWMDLIFVLVPGLFTKSYPGYMTSLRVDLQRLGLHVYVDLNANENGWEFDTDKSVGHNAKALRDIVMDIGGGGTIKKKRIVAVGHSKGSVDFAAALALYPEIRPFVACHLSLQGPHGGTPLVNDMWKTTVQKDIVFAGLEYVLKTGPDALVDMTYERRRAFHRQHPYPSREIPTICLATYDERTLFGSLSIMGQGPILLKPIIEYIRLRYAGCPCDGLVCTDDAILPGTRVVRLNDMDHFGPAYRSFPASDPYDPARLCLTLVSMVLGKENRD